MAGFEAVVAAIRDNPDVLQKHASRFVSLAKPMYEDRELHILAFEIIYCADVYNLYEGVTPPPPVKSAAPRQQQEAQERQKKIEKLKEDLLAATEKSQELEAAKDYFRSIFTPGAEVRHKTYGPGRVTALQKEQLSILFEEASSPKSFDLFLSVTRGIIRADLPDYDEKLKEYKPILLKRAEIQSSLKLAEITSEPYRDDMDL